MNESAARSALSSAQQPIDMEEFERRLRGPAPRIEAEAPPAAGSQATPQVNPHATAHVDPLAELAKIVDSVENPMQDIFGQPHAPGQAEPVAPEAEQLVGQYQPSYPAAEQGFTPDDAPSVLRNVAGQMRYPDERWSDNHASPEPEAPAANLPVLPELPAPPASQNAENYTGWDQSGWQPAEPPPFLSREQDQPAANLPPPPDLPPQPALPVDTNPPSQPQDFYAENDAGPQEAPDQIYLQDHQQHQLPAYADNDAPDHEFTGQPLEESTPVEPVHHLPVVTNAGAPVLHDTNQPALTQENDALDEFEQSVAQLVAARAAANSNNQNPANEAPSQGSFVAPLPIPVNLPKATFAEDELNTGLPASQVPAMQPSVPDIPSQIELPAGTDYPADEEYAAAFPADYPVQENAEVPALAPQEHGHLADDGTNEAPWEANNGVPAAEQVEKRSRKPLYITAAAIGVMVVGIGATLGMRGSGSGEIPTIAAIKSPLKIPGKQVASNDTPAAANILGGKSTNSKASKVVAKNDEPIDLTQVPAGPKKARRIREEELSRKLNLADKNVAQPIAKVRSVLQRRASGYFPEPRRVRTVMVRPDGTLIDPTTTANTSAAKPKPAIPAARPRAATTRPARSSIPILAAREAQPAVRRATRAAKPVSKKSARRAGTTARPNRASRPATRAALDLTPGRTATRTRAATTSPATRSGRYAVQLAAPGNETAAKSTARRMKQRYGGVLNGRTPSVHRAVVRNRTVWRVRVTGMDRKAAVSMCSRLQSRGGKCFVARN